MFINIDIFNRENNSWINSCTNAYFNDNILEAELIARDGSIKYNKIEIHPLLLNKKLDNENGTFKYNLTKEEDDEIMDKLFPIYEGEKIKSININKCVMLSINIERYNKIRDETILILNNYILPNIEISFGYTRETCNRSKFYDYMINKNQRNEYTIGMLEIFENFVNNSETENDWLLYFEDDVRPINLDKSEDLTKLYNIPSDAELIRPYIGKNEICNLKNIDYRISYGGGMCHAFYISVSGCKKAINYAKKYKWKYICDIDLFKLAKYCGKYPTGYDGWSLTSTNNVNNITDHLEDDEKINMYQLNHIIFNQTSNPCC